MEKPISVKVTDLKNKLIDDINSAEMHPTILLPVIKDIYEKVAEIEASCRAEELKMYEESCKKEERNDSDGKDI